MRLLAFVLLLLSLVGCGKPAPDVSPNPPATPQPPAPSTDGTVAVAKPFPITLTPAAAAEVSRLIREEAGQWHLRISARGTVIKLDLDAEFNPAQDVRGESRGVPVVVDRETAARLPPVVTVDFVNAGGERGFKLDPGNLESPAESATLTDARKGFVAKPKKAAKGRTPPRPPANLFQLVKYDAPVGKLSAYLTPDPKDGNKRPAIVWITGGDCNSIDDGCWTEGSAANDQSASAFRKAGIVMMFPALRGGNDNPGAKEGFLGEVDDVIAATDFLAKQPHVDPTRIYLGGHSTGGTLALLVAECSSKFRAVFSFGPVDEVAGYGEQYCPFDLTDEAELRVRSPGRWLHGVTVPTVVIEGADGGSNTGSLRAMARRSKNPNLTFIEVPGADHFSVLAPVNKLLAKKVNSDTGPAGSLKVTADEVKAAMRK